MSKVPAHSKDQAWKWILHLFLWNNRTHLKHAAVALCVLLAFHLWFGDTHKLAQKPLKRDSLLINLFFFLMMLPLRRDLNCLLPLCVKLVHTDRTWVSLMM